ncbi:MAG: TetR/AcrR family transcriptional regulator [Bacteroidota bacterium]
MTENFNHKERRQREIEAVKASILKAARDLAISKQGWPKVTIRDIARDIAYTPPVIYEHFKNKTAILIELQAYGYRQLKYALEEARKTEKEAVSQLHALTETTWDWAFKYRELYEVMFNISGVPTPPPPSHTLLDTAKPVMETIRSIRLFETEAEEYFYNWWALVHGYISLVMNGHVVGKREVFRKYTLIAVERFAKEL